VSAEPPSQLLAGRSIIVSGVGPGLGSAIARALAAEGAQLVLGDIDLAAAEAAAVAVTEAGGVAHPQRCDITNADDCRALVATAVERYGRLDGLVNDAYHGGDFKPFAEADLDDWAHTMGVNYFGSLRLTQAAIEPLADGGGGRVVMINSDGVEWIQPSFGAYEGSKAALFFGVKLLAAELGPLGIAVNGVHPGPIWGPALQGYLGMQAAERGVDLQVVYDEWASRAALRYLVPPDEIAQTVVFLLSSRAKPISGQSVWVNAGAWFH
jgi:NAD(P)-dependent dehydrogenase (short-subunit alcohol dehydrogenase family)